MTKGSPLDRSMSGSSRNQSSETPRAAHCCSNVQYEKGEIARSLGAGSSALCVCVLHHELTELGGF